ncbi:MAG: OmpA family protein [bacterium]
MKKDRSKLGQVLAIVLLLVTTSVLIAQDKNDMERSLFDKVEKLLNQVQSGQGYVLSPTNFKNALNKYHEATKAFKHGKELKGIQKKIAEARSYLKKALETAKLAKVAFATTLKAREDALKANAPEYAKVRYDEAENAFIAASKKLERGDVRNAKKRIPQINRLYRAAELTAIKVSIIGTVRNLMREAKKIEAHKYTPISYARAQKLQTEAEAILNSDRRSASSAKEKAEAAEIEAKHAIYLTRLIKQLKDDPKRWENFFLNQETSIENTAMTLGFKPDFDEGNEKPLKKIRTAVVNLQKDNKELVNELNEKNQEIQKRTAELQSYKEKQQGLQAELQEKQLRLEMKKRREDKIKSVEHLFSSDEAVVLRKRNDIIIRLIGLTFPSGKSTIEPDYFSLLSKVQRAIRKFSNFSITIEGHTDSIGDERYNENLSYERALAVKQYLLANMGLEESRITAVGYGESKPIASNETKAGRARNRRIDIVLTFSDEVL